MAKKKSKPSRSATKHLGAKVWDEFKAPLLIVAGVAGGALAGRLIDKVVKSDPTAPGFQPKALVKPVVQLAAGMGARFLSKNEYVKLIATGVTVTGVLSVTRVILKKDILQGLAEVSGLGSDAVGQVFREPMNLAIDPYNPDLPALPQQQVAAPDDIEVNGTDDGQELLGESGDKEISFM
jgi:hypothetical protein